MKILPLKNDDFCDRPPLEGGPGNPPGAIFSDDFSDDFLLMFVCFSSDLWCILTDRSCPISTSSEWWAVPSTCRCCMLCIYMPAIDRSLSGCRYALNDAGYSKIQGTKPQSIGMALNGATFYWSSIDLLLILSRLIHMYWLWTDSPAGLLGWWVKMMNFVLKTRDFVSKRRNCLNLKWWILQDCGETSHLVRQRCDFRPILKMMTLLTRSHLILAHLILALTFRWFCRWQRWKRFLEDG